MSRNEQKKIDPLYDNVKKKPIMLLKRKNSHQKYEISNCEKNSADQKIESTNGLECEKKYKDSLIYSSAMNTEYTPNTLNSVVGVDSISRYTKAELSHREVQRKRIKKQIESRASLTHRQRVSKFNEKLSMLPEHFDIPKVGPG